MIQLGLAILKRLIQIVSRLLRDLEKSLLACSTMVDAGRGHQVSHVVQLMMMDILKTLSFFKDDAGRDIPIRPLSLANDLGQMRLPLCGMMKDNEAKLKAALKAYGLI